MAGYPGEMNQPTTYTDERPRRSVFPWLVTLAFFAFLLGMLASPWFEREVRSRLPFGFGTQAVNVTPPPTVAFPQNAVVERRLRSLEQRPVTSETDATAEKDQEQRIAALETRFEALDSRSTVALANAARAEGMLLALAARRAVDTGQPLGVIEGMLRERFGGTQPQAVASLIAASQKPVTLAQLQAGLQTLEPQLEKASRGDSWWTELRNDLSRLIIIKHENAPIVEPVEQLKDARQRLMVGDVAGALWQIHRLPEQSRQKAGGWIVAARRYLAARQALDSLETVALLAPPPGQLEQVIPLPSAPAAPVTAKPDAKTPATGKTGTPAI